MIPAAPRVNILDVETILKRLDNQFKLLRSSNRSEVPRHQTIRATLDWSHELLTDEEKIVFYSLSIFAGDFDLEDAESICNCEKIQEEYILDHLAHLANKSLVVNVEKNGKRRYRLLELIKEYGREKLSDTAYRELKEKYCQFYFDKVKQSDLEQHEMTMFWMEWLTAESVNIESAIEMVSDDAARLIEITGYLYWYWYVGSKFLTGSKYLLKALENYPQEDLLRGKALAGYGNFEAYYVDLKAGLDIVHEGLNILRSQHASRELLTLLFHSAIAELFLKNYANSENLTAEGLELAEQAGHPTLILRFKSFKGGILTNQFLADEAEPIVTESLQEAKQLNSAFDIDYNSHFYADLPMIREDYEEAAIRYLEATTIAVSHGNIFLGIIDLQGVGMCLCRLGNYQEGLTIVGATIEKYASIGTTSPKNHFWNVLFMKTVGKTITEIGEERANEIMAKGRLMKFEDTIAYATELVMG